MGATVPDGLRFPEGSDPPAVPLWLRRLAEDVQAALLATPAVPAAIPAGVMVPFAGDIPAIPAGWLLCRGALVNRTTYAALFAAIGTRYGVGDGSTTFNLPHMGIGRVPVGADPTDPDFSWATAPTGGAKNVTLTTAQMPNHGHNVQTINGMNLGIPGGTQWSDVPTGVAQGASTRIPFTASGTGGGGAHNNMPPFMTVHWVIKT